MLCHVCMVCVGEHFGVVAVVVGVFDRILVMSSYGMSVILASAYCRDVRAVAVFVGVFVRMLVVMGSYGVLGVLDRTYDCCIRVVTVMRVVCWHVVEALGMCEHKYFCVY